MTRMTRDKLEADLQELGDLAGVPIIPTVTIPGGTPASDVSLADIMVRHGWRDVIIKPCVSGGSRGCRRVRGADADDVAAGQAFLVKCVQGTCSGHPVPTPTPTPTNSATSAPAARRGSVTGHAKREHNHTHDRHAAAHGQHGGHSSGDSGHAPHHTRHGSPTHHLPLRRLTSHPRMPLLDAASADEQARLAANAAAAAVSSVPLAHLASVHRDCCACDMMVQPYIPSVEAHGELSAVVIDGKITHALQKRPAAGDFRTQEEFGGRPVRATLTHEEEAMVHRVLAAARSVVEQRMLPVTPISPTVPAQVLPRPLPADALLIARLDFLRLTPEAAGAAFGSHEPMVAQPFVPAETGTPGSTAEPIISPTMQLRAGGTPPPATPSPQRTPLLLLELEIVEPSLFFKTNPGAADTLAAAIDKRWRVAAAARRADAATARAARRGAAHGGSSRSDAPFDPAAWQ